MSGGHFNCDQYKILIIVDEVEDLIRSNDDETEGRSFTPETVAEFKKGLRVLREAFIYAQRIDWLVSGVDGEERFHKRLAEELRSLK